MDISKLKTNPKLLIYVISIFTILGVYTMSMHGNFYYHHHRMPRNRIMISRTPPKNEQYHPLSEIWINPAYPINWKGVSFENISSIEANTVKTNTINTSKVCLNGKCITSFNQISNTNNQKLNVIYQYLLPSYVLPSPKVSNLLYYYAYPQKGDQLCEQTYGQGWHWCTKTEWENRNKLKRAGVLAINGVDYVNNYESGYPEINFEGGDPNSNSVISLESYFFSTYCNLGGCAWNSNLGYCRYKLFGSQWRIGCSYSCHTQVSRCNQWGDCWYVRSTECDRFRYIRSYYDNLEGTTFYIVQDNNNGNYGIIACSGYPTYTCKVIYQPSLSISLACCHS